MPETPKTREEFRRLLSGAACVTKACPWRLDSGDPCEGCVQTTEAILSTLSAAGLAVVPREAPQVAIDTASQIFGSIQAMYRETVAAADLLNKD